MSFRNPLIIAEVHDLAHCLDSFLKEQKPTQAFGRTKYNRLDFVIVVWLGVIKNVVSGTSTY